MDWTNPCYGVSHLGKITDRRWATVEDHGSFCRLLMWFRGCGFSPYEKCYNDINTAKSDGEHWVNGFDSRL